MPRRTLGPRAETVYAALRDRIGRGDLAPGARLSPYRDLAREFGVAPMTLREALDQIEDDGLISQQHGRGTFVRAPGAAVVVAHGEPARRALLEQQAEAAGHR